MFALPKPNLAFFLKTAYVFFFLFLFGSIQVWGQSPTPVPPPEILWGVKIPMRDGVKLHGNLYRPRDTKEKLPVILFMTPYVADAQHEFASAFAKNGYVVIVVDVRGRGNSDGIFVPLENQGRDGYDVVEWAASQHGQTARSPCMADRL